MSEVSKALVLVVDDNEMNRELAARRLQKMGHEYVYAENGQIALERLAEQDFDLVLLDVMMPVMGGYEVLERMKQDPTYKDIPVLMISAASEMEGVAHCIELGAEDYLPKPFKPVLLTARVNACLEKKRLRDQEKAVLVELEAERKRSQDLLEVILPVPMVEELKKTGTVQPRRYDDVAVLFADIVEFTSFCDGRPPEEVVEYLQQLISGFEDISERYGLQKIKTIGDAYMCAGGLLEKHDNPAKECVDAGLEMIAFAGSLPTKWKVRIGIHYGPVMGGIVGHRQYLFDIWGDTVNIAARLEHLAPEGTVTVSGATWDLLGDSFDGSRRDVVVRGKGELIVYDIAPHSAKIN